MAIPTYYSLLQNGSSGPDVALVQTWLNGIRDTCTCYAQLTVDGKYGSSVENAVREFQTKNGLTVDGKVGQNTWNAIYDKYAAKHGTAVPFPGITVIYAMTGAVVRYIQQRLITKNYPLTADGKFGTKTAAAVSNFQTLSGLTADGKVGKNTWAKLIV